MNKKHSIKAKIRKPKKTFSEFLKDIHNITYEQYLELNEYQQRALDMEHKENWR